MAPTPILLIIITIYVVAMMRWTDVKRAPKTISDCVAFIAGGFVIALAGALIGILGLVNPIDALLLKDANFIQVFVVGFGYAVMLVGIIYMAKITFNKNSKTRAHTIGQTLKRKRGPKKR